MAQRYLNESYVQGILSPILLLYVMLSIALIVVVFIMERTFLNETYQFIIDSPQWTFDVLHNEVQILTDTGSFRERERADMARTVAHLLRLRHMHAHKHGKKLAQIHPQ